MLFSNGKCLENSNTQICVRLVQDAIERESRSGVETSLSEETDTDESSSDFSTAKPAELLNDLDGLYKPRGAEFSNWDCKSVGEDRGAISISGNVLTLTEEACTLSNPTSVDGTAAVSFDAACAVEGTEYEAKVSLQKTNFGVVFGGDGFFEEWESCENPSAQTASVVAQDEQVELVEESKKFDGIYEITISRLGRDTELQRANNEVNAIEKLAQLTLRSEGGVLSLTTLVDWTKTFGSYQDLSGKFLADGTLQFDATGTVLYGRFEPRRLVFEVLAGEKLAAGEKVHLRVEDWDEHWAASIELRRLTDEDAVSEQVADEQADQDRLTVEREERERLAADEMENGQSLEMYSADEVTEQEDYSATGVVNEEEFDPGDRVKLTQYILTYCPTVYITASTVLRRDNEVVVEALASMEADLVKFLDLHGVDMAINSEIFANLRQMWAGGEAGQMEFMDLFEACSLGLVALAMQR